MRSRVNFVTDVCRMTDFYRHRSRKNAGWRQWMKTCFTGFISNLPCRQAVRSLNVMLVQMTENKTETLI